MWLSNIKCKSSVAAASRERRCRRDGDHPKTLPFTNHTAVDKMVAHKERRALSNVLTSARGSHVHAARATFSFKARLFVDIIAHVLKV